MSLCFKQELWLADGLAQVLPPGDAFEAAMALHGEIFRDMPGRKTMRVLLGGRAYFIKQHFGVGWLEILKNLVSGKMPILGAETEWQAIHRLHALGIATMTAVGFGRRGLNPASRRSFLLTEDLGEIIPLEDFCRDWVKNPPPLHLKRQLISAVAHIARTLHDNGLNHRDFYLGHFCLDAKRLVEGEIRIYLLDLHRMGMRPAISPSARMKDMAALYFSSMDFGLSTRDHLRFLRRYRDRPLHEIFSRESRFWRQVSQRADALYIKYQERFAALPKIRR
jgi:heptose I phosphotransferase